jgi:hypothetical protein
LLFLNTPWSAPSKFLPTMSFCLGRWPLHPTSVCWNPIVSIAHILALSRSLPPSRPPLNPHHARFAPLLSLYDM